MPGLRGSMGVLWLRYGTYEADSCVYDVVVAAVVLHVVVVLGAGEIGFGYIDDSIIYASHSGHLFYYGEYIGMELNDTDLSVKGTASKSRYNISSYNFVNSVKRCIL